MQHEKKEKLLKRIENHLRTTARQLVKFDTEEETLQFLSDSFRSELNCDFVGIILKEHDHLIAKVWSGKVASLADIFPLKLENCSPTLLEKSLTFEEVEKDSTCEFTKELFEKNVSTWFTVPLIEDDRHFGFCIIGFMSFVPLLMEMDKVFVEFGKDVAVAISLSKKKELQKRKIMGVEWFSESISLDSTIEEVVERIVERAGKGTNSQMACIYLYNEEEGCFTYQPPSYGNIAQEKKIVIHKNYVLKDHFPFLETPGGYELTVPLLIDLKTIGVLHVENKNKGTFTDDDVEILTLLSNHVATMLQNTKLYHNVKAHKQRLQYLLNYQQTLVKETVEQDNFDGITQTLSKLFSKSVLLFDRFMRPISYTLYERSESEFEQMVQLATSEVYEKKNREFWLTYESDSDIQVAIWPVDGGGDLLGYLVIDATNEDIDDYYRLSVDLARNIYSIQFIKQKSVLDAKEQVKDSFIHKLLVDKIDDRESIIQYANLFKWNLFDEHRVAVLSLSIKGATLDKDNIFEIQSKKSFIWERLKVQITSFEPEILIAQKEGEYILISPTAKEKRKPRVFWSKLYDEMNECLKVVGLDGEVFLGIGGKTTELSEYYLCYQQGVQALNVVLHRFRDIGFALFEELGAYTLLYHIKDFDVAKLFINKYLQPLLKYSEGKSMDLFQTLRMYLEQNGSIKETSERLYIHRSSLLYRLEKIESILEVDLNYSENRFNLMMAYKLHDLFYSNTVLHSNN